MARTGTCDEASLICCLCTLPEKAMLFLSGGREFTEHSLCDSFVNENDRLLKIEPW